MQKNKYDYQNEQTEKIWAIVVKIVLIPVGIAIISSFIKIIFQ